MAWTVILEDENKEIIISLNKEFNSSILSNEDFKGKFQLLKYLDPYGDTIFNKNQIDNLIADLLLLQKKCKNMMVQAVIELAKKCKNGTQIFSVLR